MTYPSYEWDDYIEDEYPSTYNSGGVDFKRTCSACPEQYDAYVNGHQAAYVRLRHGYLTAQFPDAMGTIIFSRVFSDNLKGMFDDQREREFYLDQIADAILRKVQV